MLPIELTGIFLSIISALFFAIRFPIVRKATDTGNALDAVTITLAIDASVFLILTILLNYPNLGLTYISFFTFFITGFLGPFLGLLCLYKGIERVGGSITAPMARGSLLISTLIAILFLGEYLTKFHTIGIFLLLIGVAFVSYEIRYENLSIPMGKSLDFLFPVGAMILFGFMVPLAKFGYSEETPVTVGLAIIFTTAFCFMLLFLFVSGQNFLNSFRTPEKKLYLAAGFIHSVAVGFYHLAISVSPVVIVMPFRSVSPIFVLVLSYFFLRKLEKITMGYFRHGSHCDWRNFDRLIYLINRM